MLDNNRTTCSTFLSTITTKAKGKSISSLEGDKSWNWNRFFNRSQSWTKSAISESLYEQDSVQFENFSIIVSFPANNWSQSGIEFSKFHLRSSLKHHRNVHSSVKKIKICKGQNKKSKKFKFKKSGKNAREIQIWIVFKLKNSLPLSTVSNFVVLLLTKRKMLLTA